MGNEAVNRNDLPKQNAEVARFRSILVCPFPVTVTSMPGWDLVVTPGIRPIVPPIILRIGLGAVNEDKGEGWPEPVSVGNPFLLHGLFPCDVLLQYFNFHP